MKYKKSLYLFFLIILARFGYSYPGDCYSGISFSSIDENEEYFDAFDASGIRVWLILEPSNADVETLIDLVLSRYQHHPSIAGIVIDIEWLEYLVYGQGRAVTDEEVVEWLEMVKSYNPDYGLVLVHWEKDNMPSIHPDGVVFQSDGQGFSSLDHMADWFKDWGDYFSDADVAFGVGFPDDYAWWGVLADPVGEIANKLFDEISNCKGIFWGSWNITEVFDASYGANITNISGEDQEGIGIHPSGWQMAFSPGYWVNATYFVSSKVNGAGAAVQWVLATAWADKTSHLSFPRPPDTDKDGIEDYCDNCADDFNTGQADADGDLIGDACDNCANDADNDIDKDGICGDLDNCPNDADAEQADADGDLIGDVCDKCPNSRKGEDADENGCDSFQFCELFYCSLDCFYADWKGNENKNSNDCTMVIVLREENYEPMCVPLRCGD